MLPTDRFRPKNQMAPTAGGCSTPYMLAPRSALIVVVCSTLTFAASPGAGGKAWREARWGMTPAQVLKAFPGEAQAVPVTEDTPSEEGKEVDLVIIPSVDVGGVTFEASFGFTKSKLSVLRLTAKLSDAAGLASGFEEVESLLRSKYGKPVSEARKDNVPHVNWQTGGTSVSLAMMSLDTIQSFILVVMYAPLKPGKRTQNL